MSPLPLLLRSRSALLATTAETSISHQQESNGMPQLLKRTFERMPSFRTLRYPLWCVTQPLLSAMCRSFCDNPSGVSLHSLFITLALLALRRFDGACRVGLRIQANVNMNTVVLDEFYRTFSDPVPPLCPAFCVVLHGSAACMLWTLHAA